MSVYLPKNMLKSLGESVWVEGSQWEQWLLNGRLCFVALIVAYPVLGCRGNNLSRTPDFLLPWHFLQLTEVKVNWWEERKTKWPKKAENNQIITTGKTMWQTVHDFPWRQPWNPLTFSVWNAAFNIPTHFRRFMTRPVNSNWMHRIAFRFNSLLCTGLYTLQKLLGCCNSIGSNKKKSFKFDGKTNLMFGLVVDTVVQ